MPRCIAPHASIGPATTTNISTDTNYNHPILEYKHMGKKYYALIWQIRLFIQTSQTVFHRSLKFKLY